MSSGTGALPTAAPQTSSSPLAPSSPSPSSAMDLSKDSPRKLRVHLSTIQGLAAKGRVRLSPGEIQLFQQKGFLRSDTATQALATICETTAQGQTTPLATTATSNVISATSSTSTRPPSSPSSSSSSSTSSSKSPLVGAGTPRMTTAPTNNARQRHHSVAQNNRQAHPPFHSQIFEDTCSHLHPQHPDLVIRTPGSPSMDISTSFRRHSESSTWVAARLESRVPSMLSLATPRSSLPTSYHPSAAFSSSSSSSSSSAAVSTVDYTSSKRVPTTAIAPVVSTPLGLRTVLYAAASPAHTLYSLPTQDLAPGSPLIQTHTPAMDDFKFPADTPSSPPASATNALVTPTFTFTSAFSNPSTTNTPTSPTPTTFPSSSLTCTPPRSKRKRAPMRSPSWADSQDMNPGVIFQLPFGSPLKSPSLSAGPGAGAGGGGSASTTARLDDGQNTPPTPGYSSNWSRVRQDSGSGSEAGAENSLRAAASSGAPLTAVIVTPASPLRRSGLGIQVPEQTFSEPGATHPLDPPALDLEDKKQSSADTFIPTPPATSEVLATQKMEVTPEVVSTARDQPASTVGDESSTAAKPLPVQSPSGDSERLANPTPAVTEAEETPAPCSNSGSPKAEAISSVLKNDGADDADDANEMNIDDDNDYDHKETDPTVLPLWAQRQLSIRRQSLIPRPDLDFVKGSGILPPASKDLSTGGGATILTYPVLLSDIVKVAMDDAQAKVDADLDQSVSPPPPTTTTAAGRHEENAASMTNQASNGTAQHHTMAKRKRAANMNYGKKRGSISFPGLRQEEDEEDIDTIEDLQGGVGSRYNKRRRSQQYGLDADSLAPGLSSKLLGSPVELSVSTFGTGRRGSAVGASSQRRHSVHQQQQPTEGKRKYQRRASLATAGHGKQTAGGGGRRKSIVAAEQDATDKDEDDGDDPEYIGAKGASRAGVGTGARRGGRRKASVDERMNHMEGDQRHAIRSLQPLLDAMHSEGGDQDEEEDLEDEDVQPLPKPAKGVGRGNGGKKSHKKKIAIVPEDPQGDVASFSPRLDRKRSIHEHATDHSLTPTKRAKSGKDLKKMTSHSSTAMGSKKSFDKKTMVAIEEQVGSSALDSLAMASTLVELHDQPVDDDETEDEMAAYASGSNSSHSGSGSGHGHVYNGHPHQGHGDLNALHPQHSHHNHHQRHLQQQQNLPYQHHLQHPYQQYGQYYPDFNHHQQQHYSQHHNPPNNSSEADYRFQQSYYRHSTGGSEHGEYSSGEDDDEEEDEQEDDEDDDLSPTPQPSKQVVTPKRGPKPIAPKPAKSNSKRSGNIGHSNGASSGTHKANKAHPSSLQPANGSASAALKRKKKVNHDGTPGTASTAKTAHSHKAGQNRGRGGGGGGAGLMQAVGGQNGVGFAVGNGHGSMEYQPSVDSVMHPPQLHGQMMKGSASSGSGSGTGSASVNSSGKHCEACGAKETPCWRPGYSGTTVLCNSCGLRYKKSGVFCTKENCKYIPLKTEYANMEADRIQNGRDYLLCCTCGSRVAKPKPKSE